MRKLASIRTITEIRKHDNADALELAIIEGWQCVVKKGEFAAGSTVVYFEIDSFIPNAIAPFLTKGQKPRTFNGVEGERLKTIRLRGELSQGLVLPVSILPADCEIEEGKDVTEILNVQKWERPLAPHLVGLARSTFPTFIPKTDEERIQNASRMLRNVGEGATFEVTEKLHGTSCTVYVNGYNEDGTVNYGVCSRNIDLKETEENTYWRVARNDGIIQAAISSGMNIAIQGEIIGFGIEGNQYGLSVNEHSFRVFKIYLIDEKRYMEPIARRNFCQLHGLRHVPVIDTNFTITDMQISDILAMAEGKSVVNGSEREGLVFKCNQQENISFKAISNNWLLNEK